MEIADYTEMLTTFLTSAAFTSFVRIALLVAIGLPLISIIARVVSNFSKSHGSVHVQTLIKRAVTYLGVIFIGISILHELGFHISAILGAAGIAGAAIAFASQTSVSNIISGLFIITERPFSIGDVIEIGGILGNVESIDLLSVKMRTFDQNLVRIPNESIIKNNLRNISYFPHRRLNFTFTVSHNEDVRKAISAITKTIKANEFSDNNREALVYLKGHTDTNIHIFVGAYALQKNYFPMLKTLTLEIKEALDKANISVPYSHLAELFEGTKTD